MVLDLPARAVFTRVSDGNPLRRLDVRSKACGRVTPVFDAGVKYSGTPFRSFQNYQADQSPVRVRFFISNTHGAGRRHSCRSVQFVFNKMHGAAFLKTAVHFRRGKGHYGRAFLIAQLIDPSRIIVWINLPPRMVLDFPFRAVLTRASDG